MASNSSAARTNLTSRQVSINRSVKLGEGAFRIAYAGTYIGGNRNSQEAVCKCFKSFYQPLETEFYQADYQVADRAIEYAEGWNAMCESGKEILMTKGDIMELGSTKYLVEPLIRYFTKFTSNNGWIASVDDEGWEVLAMEAFSHYTYHRSGGQLIVCDLQGRYRSNPYNNKPKSRFELTDPAICSRRRMYGPTDLGEKGIESFFANHCCNQFCHADGKHWSSPRAQQNWFVRTSATSMLRTTATHMLTTTNPARFNSQLQPFYEDDDDSDDSY
jgi:Alpha-kinase family